MEPVTAWPAVGQSTGWLDGFDSADNCDARMTMAATLHGHNRDNAHKVR
jgi:hypothetical protein